LVWAKDYLFPWVVRRVRQRPANLGLTAKRPEPGPVFGPGVAHGPLPAGPFPTGPMAAKP
jgi:hypothetical protein